MIAKRDRTATPVRRVARMLTMSRGPSTSRVLVAWEEGAAPDPAPSCRRMFVLVESTGSPPIYVLFDNLYDGLPIAQVRHHTAALQRLLADLDCAGIQIATVANPVASTRRMRSAEAVAHLLEQPIESPRPHGMTQRRSPWAGAGLAIGAFALTGCAHTPPTAPSPVSIAPPIARSFVQARQQPSGLWELVPCVEGTCLRPTPKTLAGVAAAAEVVPIARRAEAGSAPVASSPKIDARASDAMHVSSLPVRSVFFRTGSAVPDPSQAAAIQSLAPALIRAKRIVVTGCTDQTGTRATNQRLAEQRAAGLRDLLVRLGVRKEQIEFQIDLSGNGNLPGTGVTDRIPEDVNARARRGDIAIV